MAHPGKLSSLVIKNTLSARDIWADTVNVKDSDGKSKDIVKLLDSKLNEIKLLESTLKTTMTEINKIVLELNSIKSPSVQMVPIKGEIGPMGPPGPAGPPGKPGSKGLKGSKGDSIHTLASIPDVDTSDLVDGSILVWSASKKKWVSQIITE